MRPTRQMPDLIHSKNQKPGAEIRAGFFTHFCPHWGDRKNIMVNQQGSKNFSDSVKK